MRRFMGILGNFADVKKIRIVLVLIDTFLLIISFLGANLLRVDFSFSNVFYKSALMGSILYALVGLIFGLLLGIYYQKFLFGSFEEILAINTQIFLTSLVTLAIRMSQDNQSNYPRSLPIIAGLIFVLGSLGIRVLRRIYITFPRPNHFRTRNILIYGAGSLGNHIASLVILDKNLNLVGFMEDDVNKRQLAIRGKKILGDITNLKEILAAHKIDQIIIAISNISEKKIELIREISKNDNVNIKIIPSAAQLMSGIGNLQDLISFNEENILGRSPVSIDKESIRQFLENKRILVTGAGGSIGSEIVKQCNQYSPEKIYLLDRDESALHSLELELFGTGLMNSDCIVLADVRDKAALKEIFSEYKPQIVFHAAALKHLPILEKYPDEAWKTNVTGTENILEACLDNDVEIVVNISTDKAANASSQLGKTKYQAEVLTSLIAKKAVERKEGAKYLSVRFGNVIGSRGSVLHTFKYQIDNNLPVTITDPEVTRYFMTVQEAVNLVLQATVVGESGETLILDMGAPVKIKDVADFMIAQSGKNVEIKYTGLRDGEKLHEVLNSNIEKLENKLHPKIFHTRVDL